MATSVISFKIYSNIIATHQPLHNYVLGQQIYIPLVLPLSSFCLVLISDHSFFKYRFQVVKHKLLAPYISTCNSTHFNHKREKERWETTMVFLFLWQSQQRGASFSNCMQFWFLWVCASSFYIDWATYQEEKKLEDGLGLDCFSQNFGFLFIGFLLRLSDWTPSIVTLSKTASLSGTYEYLSLSHTYEYSALLAQSQVWLINQ